MKMKNSINQSSAFGMAIIVFTVLIHLSAHAGSISGVFSNTNLDMSKMGENKSTSITYDPSNNAVMGIKAHKAKDSVVGIDKYNEVETNGAIVFAGTNEKKWSMAKVHVVSRLKSPKNNLFKDSGISGVCTNLIYEGVVDGTVDFKLNNGKTNWYHVAKPITGVFEKVTVSDNPENAFDIDRDFSDGWIESTKYGKVQVLIISSINMAQLIFIVDENKLKGISKEQQPTSVFNQ